MNPAWSVLLSVRKLFGFLIPGFVWLVLVSVWHPMAIEGLLRRVEGIWSHAGFVVPVAIVTSYFTGAISSVVAFRFLELFGDGVDWLLSRVRSRTVRAVIGWISRRLHVLSTTTLTQDTARLEQAAPSDDFSIEVASRAGHDRWGIWKMYILEASPALGKEALDTEGEINFMAGMFGPTLGMAVWAFGAYPLLGYILVVTALYLALRFQTLRHHERWFALQAYEVARHLRSRSGAYQPATRELH